MGGGGSEGLSELDSLDLSLLFSYFLYRLCDCRNLFFFFHFRLFKKFPKKLVTFELNLSAIMSPSWFLRK
jgi:hypothetical protein